MEIKEKLKNKKELLVILKSLNFISDEQIKEVLKKFGFKN